MSWPSGAVADDRTVIFDVDGTLVDTNYHHALAWYQALLRHGVTVPVWRIHRAIGMGGDRLVAEVAGDGVEDRVGDEVRDAWKSIFDQLIGEIRGFDGARELVAAAKKRWQVVLASSGDPDHIRHYLDLLDLHNLTDDWTSAEDVANSKPAPDLLENRAGARQWAAGDADRRFGVGLRGGGEGRGAVRHGAHRRLWRG